MPRGDKSSYTGKQKRQAEHIEEGYERRGVSKGEAERRAWATVNKETGGGKKRGSGRGKRGTRGGAVPPARAPRAVVPRPRRPRASPYSDGGHPGLARRRPLCSNGSEPVPPLG